MSATRPPKQIERVLDLALWHRVPVLDAAAHCGFWPRTPCH